MGIPCLSIGLTADKFFDGLVFFDQMLSAVIPYLLHFIDGISTLEVLFCRVLFLTLSKRRFHFAAAFVAVENLSAHDSKRMPV
jgi:hypothetical protein